jgi:cytochrome c6
MKTVITCVGVALALFLSLAVQADDAATYVSKCAACHGKDGAGDTAMGKKMGLKDLRDAKVQAATDADWEKLIADGKGKMPAYKGKISPAEIKGLVKYMRSFKAK